MGMVGVIAREGQCCVNLGTHVLSEASLREQVMTDAHSPEEFRVDTVCNLDAWYAAFDVKPGDQLYLAPADRIRIW
jgi:predicted metalloendopeptidase